jgi:hypothetical protein
MDSPSNWEKFSYSHLYVSKSLVLTCAISLVIALKPHLDLSSRHKIIDSLKLRKRKTRKENTANLAICVVLINLILSVASIKHNVISILINLSNFSINPLKMRRHANLPIGVVCSIEEQCFARTVLHIAFMDHGPIKLEWSLISSDTNWRTENGDQRGVNRSLKFLLKYSTDVPNSNSKNKRTQERCIHEPTGGWVPPVMTKKYSGIIENQRNRAHDERQREEITAQSRTIWGLVSDCPATKGEKHDWLIQPPVRFWNTNGGLSTVKSRTVRFKISTTNWIKWLCTL